MEMHETKNPMDLFKVLGEMTKPEKIERPLFEIAREIRREWKDIPRPAEVHLEAFDNARSIDEMFIHDTVKSEVCYFLSNVQTWRGDKATELKNELRVMVGLKPTKPKKKK